MRYVLVFLALPLLAGDLEKSLADVATHLPERSKAAFEKVAKANSITVTDVLRSMLEQYTSQLTAEHDPEVKKRVDVLKAAQAAAKQAEDDLKRELKVVFPDKTKE